MGKMENIKSLENYSFLQKNASKFECENGGEWTQSQQWAGAFLGATMVTSCALGSVFLIPCRNSRFYVLLSNCLVALAISTASGASFFQLAPSAVGLDDDEMTQPFVIVPASVMCLVFWYCLTLDKIKASFKREFDVKSGRRSIISFDKIKTDDNEEESCMGKGPCRGLRKGCRENYSVVLHVNQI